MDRSIFKAYDIRGIYPTHINEDVAQIVGKACAQMFDAGTFILAHDARHGSPELIKALELAITQESTATNKNIKIINVGLATTPMFYFLVNHFNASGGCMVTASHNPKEYNGMKIVGKGAEMVSGTHVLAFIDSMKS